MRHAATHLVVALCTTMAVSSAPVSPNPVSPALVSPMVIPDSESFDLQNDNPEKSAPEKRSIGGFNYQTFNENNLARRATDDPNQYDSNNQVNTQDYSDSEADMNSDFGSESDYEIRSASDGETQEGLQRRSIPEIWTRSPPPSPQNIEDFNDDYGDTASVASFDDNDSITSDNYDYNTAEFSDDRSASISSDLGDLASKSQASDQGKQQNQSTTPESATDEGKEAKVKARGLGYGSQSDRHGGRNYISQDSWNA